MSVHLCDAVREWLLHDAHMPPTEAFVAHCTRCARCQTMLATLLATLAHTAPPDVVGCAQCDADLAAFLDLELQAGNLAALRAYPHVWWHVWTCRDCAETYRLLQMLVDAEQSDQLAFPPLLATAMRVAELPSLRLNRAQLVRAFATSTALGVAWGQHDEERVLAEHITEEQCLTLSVRQAEHHCLLRVSIEPRVVGHAVLHFGQAVTRAPFDTDGIADFAPLPLQRFTDPAGPDLLVEVEAQ